MVETALILPLLLIVVFGIIDLGYYIYGYAAIYQAARNGAEVAATAPPYPIVIPEGGAPIRGDPCVEHIIEEIELEAALFRDDIADSVTITFPEYQRNPYYDPTVMNPNDRRHGEFLSYENRRQIGYPIEVSIAYEIEPLTPLWNLVPVFGDEGMMQVNTTARRSIGNFGRDPTADDLSSCQDMLPAGIPGP